MFFIELIYGKLLVGSLPWLAIGGFRRSEPVAILASPLMAFLPD